MPEELYAKMVQTNNSNSDKTKEYMLIPEFCCGGKCNPHGYIPL